MAKEHLVPFKKGDKWPSIASKRKLGKHYPKKSIAAKIVWMKKRGITTDGVQEIYDLMTDSDMSALDVLVKLKKLYNEAETPKEQAALLSKMMDWHRMHHGDKKQIDMRVAKIDLNEPLSEDARRLLLEDLE